MLNTNVRGRENGLFVEDNVLEEGVDSDFPTLVLCDVTALKTTIINNYIF